MRGQTIRFVDFRGGVNTKAAPYLVAENECRDCRNVVSTVRGSIRKRNGCQTFSTPAAELHTLVPLEATATNYLIGVSNSAFSRIESNGTATAIAKDAAVTQTSGLRYSFVQAPIQSSQGPLYGSNGTDTPIYYAGSGDIELWTLASGTVPRPKHLATHANRVWGANLTGGTGVYGSVSDAGSALVFSELGDPRTFPTANIVLLDPNDGDEITGLGKVGPYLVAFKRRKTFVIYDGDTGANRRISDTIGCTAAKSIAEGPQGLFFLTPDRGVYRTGGQALELVSDNIAPTLDGLTGSQKAATQGVVHDDHYYLSAPGSFTADLDLTLGSWWLHSYAPNAWARMTFTDDDELYASNNGIARVSKAFVSGVHQDNAANYTAYWKGPWQSFKTPYLRKRMRQIHLDGTGPLDLYVARDFNAGSDLADSNLLVVTSETFGGSGYFGSPDTGTFGGASDTQEDEVYTLGVGRSWSVIFQAATDSAMEIDAYAMSITPRKD